MPIPQNKLHPIQSMRVILLFAWESLRKNSTLFFDPNTIHSCHGYRVDTRRQILCLGQPKAVVCFPIYGNHRTSYRKYLGLNPALMCYVQNVFGRIGKNRELIVLMEGSNPASACYQYTEVLDGVGLGYWEKAIEFCIGRNRKFQWKQTCLGRRAIQFDASHRRG